jgi:putative glutamine amidotransferase
MKHSKPVIGITSGYDFDKCMSYVKEGYYDAVFISGGIPVLLPVTDNKNIIDDYINICDGFILSGGPDVEASYFGENNMPYTGEISPVRDAMEIAISRKALELDKPILGICRGCQVLNIAAGGTIYQDIYAESAGGDALLKHNQQAPKWYPIHTVEFENNSMLNGIFNNCELSVNSFHHQAIKDTADGFITAGRAKDGIIEAVCSTKNRFALGVQWHPELLWQKNSIHLKLFERLIALC